MKKLALKPKKVAYNHVHLNGKYLYTEVYTTFNDPTPNYTKKELDQLSKYC